MKILTRDHREKIRQSMLKRNKERRKRNATAVPVKPYGGNEKPVPLVEPTRYATRSDKTSAKYDLGTH
jgi:hypothetical protein